MWRAVSTPLSQQGPTNAGMYMLSIYVSLVNCVPHATKMYVDLWVMCICAVQGGCGQADHEPGGSCSVC